MQSIHCIMAAGALSKQRVGPGLLWHLRTTCALLRLASACLLIASCALPATGTTMPACCPRNARRCKQSGLMAMSPSS